MRASISVVQIPATWDVEQNLLAITAGVADTHPDEIVVLPEGALSGYADDLSPLDDLDPAVLNRAANRVAELARQRGIHLFCGSLLFEHGVWWNSVLYFSPHGDRWAYRKINLAMHERGRLRAGAELSTVELRLPGGLVTAGVQICREIRFPEQWQHLAASGAQIFVYLTHATNPSEPTGVWRSHLISRAAENQRFVLAANVADSNQHCPSMIISPRGLTLAESATCTSTVLKTAINIDEIASWYLEQRRSDVVQLHYRDSASCRFALRQEVE